MSGNVAPKIVTDGLILYLDAGNTKSYSGSGTTWTDISRGGNNGTLTNGPTYNSGNGGFISLDGTNDSVTIPKSLNGFTYNIHYDINWTIECWMYMSTPSSSPQTYKSIYGNYNGCSYGLAGNAGGFIIYNANNPAAVYSTLSFGPKSPTGCPDGVSWINSESSWVYSDAVNKWCHFVLTSDDGTNYRIFVNGIQRGATKTFDFKNSAGRSANNLVATSNYAWGGNVIGWNKVDFSSMRIYNRPLSSTEVLQNYNATKGRFGL